MPYDKPKQQALGAAKVLRFWRKQCSIYNQLGDKNQT